ncbi:TRAP transporter small permease subunit, partial [uncultured Succinatimonas sp.]
SMPFVEELTPMGLVVLSIVGAAVAAKKGAHLGLTVITDLLSPKYQKLCVLFAHALGFIFGIIILYYGLDTVRVEYLLEFVTSGMQWPEWIFGITIPLGGFILAVRYLQLFITELKK